MTANPEPRRDPAADGDPPCPGGRRRRHGGLAVLAALLLGAVGGAGLSAALEARAHGGHGGEHGAARAERVQARALDRAQWVLAAVDATPGQQQRVAAIVRELLGGMAPLLQTHRETRRALLEALSRPQVDRDALEKIRRTELGLFEQASGRLVSALADTAEVLTAAQRRRILEHLGRGHHRH